MIQFNDINQVFTYYQQFKDLSILEIYNKIEKKFPDVASKINIEKPNKSIVGLILEGIIGSPPNNDPNPDIKGLGVELKVLPLRKIGRELNVKERSKIKSINYNDIQLEQWETSLLRKKIKIILFNTYIQPTGMTFKDWRKLYYKGPLLFYLKENTPQQIKSDWLKIAMNVKNGRAHELSEGLGKILGAATSGSGKEVVYKNGLAPAKERSYSLKHSYLKRFYREVIHGDVYKSVSSAINDEKIEDFIISKFSELKNLTLYELSKKYKIDFKPQAKNSFRLLINSLFNISRSYKIKELEESDVLIKTVPVSKTYHPYEAMSFPKFSLVEMLDESWEDSDFKNRINRNFLIIPIIKDKIKNPITKKHSYNHWHNWKVGNIFTFKPTIDDLNGIKKEWIKSQEIILNGVKTKIVHQKNKKIQKNNLLKSSKTNFIHMRPHGQNSKDIDFPFYNHSGLKITWQCFWFNKSYIKTVISRSIN